jgi:hypothetical protein
VVFYAASRYRECIEKCEEAVKLLNQTGDRWEVNTATWHIAFSHYRLGELAEAVGWRSRCTPPPSISVTTPLLGSA